MMDILYFDKKFYHFKSIKLTTQDTHKTGCSIASAIASNLALGNSLDKACELSIKYIQNGILNNFKVGNGRGPINHFFMLS